MRRNERQDPSSLIPVGERQCIWMDAGVISLKICERDFDCDRCPLDRALRGEDRDRARGFDESALAPILEPLSKLAVDTSLHYHPGHTWARVESPERVRVGLDPLLVAILGSIDALASQRAGRPVTRGTALGEIVQGDRCFPVLSPVSGDVLEVNPELETRPMLAVIDPLGQGWLLAIAPLDLDADLARCRTGRPVLSWTLRGLDWVNACVTPDLTERQARLGPTLHDGGQLCGNLRDLLPPERYRRLVLRLLGDGDEWDLEP